MSAPAPAMFSAAALRRAAELRLTLGKPNLEAFAATLTALARADRNVLAVTSDSRGSGKLGPFGQALPDQIIEVGIAEQNLVGVAAGLASSGKTVFAVSPACFLTARSLEQIKNDVAYSDNPVALVGISAGIAIGLAAQGIFADLFAALAITPARRVKGAYPLIGNALPTNYVIDRAGVVRYAKAAAFELDDLNTILAPLLAEAPPA